MIDITIQETVNDVEITVNQTVITVNVTRTTGGGGGGVESVTGTLVDNTDPLNPIINTPSFAETLAEDNKTNNIPIVSNNGKAVVDVNDDYLKIGYEDSYGISGITFDSPSSMVLESFWGIDLKSLQIALEAEVNVNIYTPDLTWNDDTIATQPWVTSQGYGTTETLAQTLAVDNKTNDIPFISNNGKAVVTVNDDYLLLGYDGGDGSSNIAFDGVSAQIHGLVLASVDAGSQITISAPAVNITASSLTYNYEEVATQPYADAKVANDLTASTTVAPSKTAVNTALDFTRRLITKGTGSVTGTVSETIITTLTIPANTLDSSCFIWSTMDFFKTNAGSVTARLYINSANTLTGATLLGFVNLGSNRNVSFNRKFLVTGTSLDLLTSNTALSQASNEFIEALYGASTVLTINPSADIFLIYTTQNDATGTVATNKMATVQKMKL